MGPAPCVCAASATICAFVPFLVYVTLFMLIPTAIVVIGAFQSDDGTPTLQNIVTVLGGASFRDAFMRSITLSAQTAIIGATLGGLLAWALVDSDPNGWLRRIVLSASAVLAQFGGVMLAFAFLATFGFNGLATMFMREVVGLDVLGGTWIYGMNGLVVVYSYFQIPLMVIIFLPALGGLRREWQEASSSLGRLGVAVLAPRGWAGPGPELPRRAAAALRECLLRVRDRGGAREPGQPHRAPAHPGCAHQ